MTKMLANRLKLVLNYIILDLQSAFIPGRLIPNNVMIAFETGHYIRRNTKGKEGVVSLKMDMSKAYDIVEWGFLKSMIAKLGFCDKWINLIMLFVSSVRYMVRQEGNEIGPIIPLRGYSKGIRFCHICFSFMRRDSRQFLMTGFVIHGCRVARTAPEV